MQIDEDLNALLSKVRCKNCHIILGATITEEGTLAFLSEHYKDSMCYVAVSELRGLVEALTSEGISRQTFIDWCVALSESGDYQQQ